MKVLIEFHRCSNIQKNEEKTLFAFEKDIFDRIRF